MAGATPGRAFFGPPSGAIVPGGTHITVYLIPVFAGGLVVFDVESKEARGRWLPWDVLDFRQNPYEAAAALADQWCNVALDDLRLVDLMSFPVEGGGWELAITFRAALAEMPPGDQHRRPFRFEPGSYDAIGPFDPVDIERWVGAVGATRDVSGGKLVF
ncbi:MAG: hypothetical protein WD557_01825 [Dehalococcoidia bacterium]